jgi:8-oxo-dGTP pyrophosphatase MutT (NUDIX family)
MNKQNNVSYGIIIYKLINKIPYYCLICRKDSYTYSEFLRGKYQLEDVDTIYKMFSYMTESEKEVIINNDFDTLWNNIWVLDKKKMASYKFKKEYNHSKYKFDTLKKGYFTTVHLDIGKREKRFIILDNILTELTYRNIPKYFEPEWGFPKGKKNKNESPFDCAKREVIEETNIPTDILVFHTDVQYEESFVGDNFIEYLHIYYLAECINDIDLKYDSNNIHQFTEISSIEWLTYEECINKIREYNVEKKQLLALVHNNLVKSI